MISEIRLVISVFLNKS